MSDIPDAQWEFVSKCLIQVQRERDESRREHLVTQEQLAIVTQHRDALAAAIDSHTRAVDAILESQE